MRDLRSPRFRHLLTELRSVKPDSTWVAASRSQLLQKIDQAPAVQASFFERLRLALHSVVPANARAILRGPVAAVLSGIAVIVGGSMASVSASEQAIPGDLLYPIKLVSEQTQLVLTTDKKEKVRLKGEFVNRRVEEIKKIAQTNSAQKPEQIKEATEILRRDLDTVKNQLSAVSQDAPVDRVEVAQLIDKSSTEAAKGLKEVKASLPSDIRSQVTDVEATAVNTSVKAVNVILDTQDDVNARKLVSKEQLIQSISQKVEGISDHIASATQQLAEVGLISATATNALTSSATSSLALSLAIQHQLMASSSTLAVSTSSVADLLSAHTSLVEARQLLSQDRLSEVGDKLIEASTSASHAENAADALKSPTNSSSSTSAEVPNATNATSSPPLAATTPVTTTPSSSPPTTTVTSSTAPSSTTVQKK